MKNESLDPKIDRMIAALYGELSESEERAFHRLLEKDDAMRAEWEELRQSRSLLSAWEVEERVPSFVMLEEAPRRTTDRRAGGPAMSLWQRFSESLRGFGTAPAWGLATAAVAVAAFMLADSRVEDKVQRQLDERLAQAAPSVSPGMPIESLGRPRDPAGGQGSIVPASASYVTRDELEATNQDLVESLVALLNQYSEQEDDETLELMRALYDRVNKQQVFDYRQLAGRIDDLGQELLLNRSLAEQQIDDLLGPAGPRDEIAPTFDGEE